MPMTTRRRTYTKQPHLWKRSGSSTWYIVWQEGPTTKKLSTGTDKRVVAEETLRRFHEERNAAWGQSTPITFHEGVREWLADRERPRHGLAQPTLSHYRTWARQFLEYFPASLRADAVSPAMVRRYLDAREDRGLGNSSLKKDLVGLSMVFRFLEREGRLRGNPCTAVRVRATPKRHPAMTAEEFASLRDAMTRNLTGTRTSALRRSAQELLDMADVLWHSGLRSIEATRLAWTDIDVERSLWTIRSPANKGGHATIPIHPELLPLLTRRKLLGMEGPFRNHHWLSITWRRFKKTNPSFQGWSWHRMRHSFVTRLRRVGADAVAMQLARHKTPAMSDHYTHLTLADLRAGMARLSGQTVESQRAQAES
ncbi:MAG: tyrosine-type recombinase/integrase [Planctomycetes bacterium]|nr:tyrosine-type recombinase/integrase [Planctomycetota bacterium]